MKNFFKSIFFDKKDDEVKKQDIDVSMDEKEISAEENIEVDMEENENKPYEHKEETTMEKEEESKGFFSGFLKGLSKTRENISNKIDNILVNFTKIDDDLYEELEDSLILSDIGAKTTMELIDRLKLSIVKKKISSPGDIKGELNLLLKEIMQEKSLSNKLDTEKLPLILLVVGVNGVGKTTSIGKLAKKFKDQGNSVILVAADTFRAAAIDQLGEWSKRVGVEMIAHNEGADPAAVVYDAIKSAKAKNIDIMICDTAGRLHNKKNLMNELEKIHRIISREYKEARCETLLVLDATTGQNAMNQAKEFNEVSDISGIILTKMDGTAKGGIVVRIQTEFEIPIKFIGLGEGVEDLKEFNTEDFINSII